MYFLALIPLYLAAANAQQVGTLKTEVHPSLPWQKCTKSGGCVTQSQGKVVLDANWRWVHTTSGYANCYTGQKWDASVCPDGVTCAQNCAVDGADYSGTYGITTSGNALTLKFVTKGENSNVGSRVYLMASDDTNYEMFKLKNQEFTFDVDVSNLPCGLNGALYFSEMAADGGKSKYANNKAGAKYGTGYCDAQCPRDIKFINGEANVAGWTGSDTDASSGKGNYGTCCNEMDIWEANSIANAYTPHPCTVTGQTRCSGTQCADYCDQPGCDWNPYRMGDKDLYGPGKVVDTKKKMTVVTQFITADNTPTASWSRSGACTSRTASDPEHQVDDPGSDAVRLDHGLVLRSAKVGVRGHERVRAKGRDGDDGQVVPGRSGAGDVDLGRPRGAHAVAGQQLPAGPRRQQARRGSRVVPHELRGPEGRGVAVAERVCDVLEHPHDDGSYDSGAYTHVRDCSGTDNAEGKDTLDRLHALLHTRAR
ncbi:beta-1,4-D-glucan cellobiohydrolase [Rhizoctonia solani]|uniref:Glucanase n=1 Tax=Rhizoctonia solani TaxID=456999 RepID=A0A8H8T024_9AGAM|nr:beta-1,4-D-glucan cellobiohydrolase [Rhizoctonia solani]QRW24024.1 beta-1,4-D-glucan cellobiohydrolase [Rhizoctonia solani]